MKTQFTFSSICLPYATKHHWLNLGSLR